MTRIAPHLAALLWMLAAPAVAGPAGGNGATPAKEAAPADATAPSDNGQLKSVGQSAGRIASQPARDVGVAKTKIAPVLVAASRNPYSLKGIRTCREISAAFRALTEVIGPDFSEDDIRKENRAGKLAEAGGQTVVNSLIPFRGLVREVTGAAPAQRRLNRALDAGYARRGFLRGVHQTRKCKTRLN